MNYSLVLLLSALSAAMGHQSDRGVIQINIRICNAVFFLLFFQDIDSSPNMVGGLANRAILDFMRSDNVVGLNSFLENGHSSRIEDRDEVG